MSGFSLPGQGDVGIFRQEGLSRQQEISANKLVELEAIIDKCNVKNQKLDSAKATDKSDWTQSYSYWSQWEDVEDLTQKKETEEENFTKLLSRSTDFMGHTHDHAKERNIFYLPEKEKLTICENHRQKGNFLFYEGIYPKAAEQYQIALSYYEYCFPESDEAEAAVESVRHACLCNISLCYYKMKEYRQAVECASNVIKEDATNGKAYFWRAQAYRGMEEFELAADDLKKALQLCPVSDSSINREQHALSMQRQLTQKKEQVLAQAMLGVSPGVDATSANTSNGSSGNQNEYWVPLIDVEQPLEPVLQNDLHDLLC
jgi:tetratricopeptide (TPR) repeat protein